MEADGHGHHEGNQGHSEWVRLVPSDSRQHKITNSK